MHPRIVDQSGDEHLDGGLASSASKVLSLLDVIAQAKGRIIGVSELALLTTMPKSTTHRLLKVLEGQGYVGRVGAKYRLGPRLFELDQMGRWSEYGLLREVAAGPIEWLFEQAGTTVHLAVLDANEVLYIEKVTGVGGMRIPSRVGARMPATCTALGKATLAFSTPETIVNVLRVPLARRTPHSIANPRLLVEQLKEVRATGLAHEEEESRLGVSCVAAPVLRGGQSVAAISLSHVNLSPQRLTRYRELVTEAASSIAGLLSESAQPCAAGAV